MQYIYNTEEGDRNFEVVYHYETEEPRSRWLPPSPAMVDYMEIFENGINILESLPPEILYKIEEACKKNWFEGYRD